MIIKTLSWGELNVGDDQLFHFPKGVPGFEGETDFALLSADDGPFWYLQSVKEIGLSFLIVDPFLFYPHYEFELSSEVTEELQIESDILIRCIITLKQEVEQSTINLLAPIVLNPSMHLGKQIVLHGTSYQTKHSLVQGQVAGDRKDGA